MNPGQAPKRVSPFESGISSVNRRVAFGLCVVLCAKRTGPGAEGEEKAR
jgi:hypothetical protein